jgi:hypothetical protein
MICADNEMASPQVRPPMAHHLYQSNKLPFICCKFEVASSEPSTEEGEGAVTLVLKGPNMARGGVNSLFKKIYKALEQRISITKGDKQFCSSSTRIASHLSNNSSCYNL